MATNEQVFSPVGGPNTAIDTVLTQKSQHIGDDIHRRILHSSPWISLIKQTKFPDGVGHILGTLIYDRVLPTTAPHGSTLGTNWINVGTNPQTVLQTGSTLDQIFVGAPDTHIGPGDNNANGMSFVQFARQLKQYGLRRAMVKSPLINVEDLRFATHRGEQLRAILDALADSTKFTWEERYRDEYDRLCANFVPCLTSGTPIVRTLDVSAGTQKEGTATGAIDLNNDFVASGVDVDYTPTARLSNKILDRIYMRIVREGGSDGAYGRENARPIFGLVCSSEASYELMTESGFRDDVRYNNARVSELIAPLGVEKSFRGFYHLIDDLAPRFTISAGVLTRVFPYTAASGIVSYNPAYDAATHEVAYVLHSRVMESQVPDPMSGSNGLSFDPVNYKGKFEWLNIADEVRNPLRTTGFFLGVLASASKPIRTEFGYAILFARNTTFAA